MPAGLAGLHQLVGNRATGRLLNRKISVRSSDLPSNSTFGSVKALFGQSSYEQIRQALDRYHHTSSPGTEAEILMEIKDLIATWNSRNPGGDADVQGRRTQLQRLAMAIQVEIARLPTAVVEHSTRHRDYDADITRQLGPAAARPFQAFSPQTQPVFGLQEGQAEKRAAAEAAKAKYGLDDAEIRAIRVYSAGDFNYINPAMVKAADRKPFWNSWMAGGVVESQMMPKGSAPTAAQLAAHETEGRRHGAMLLDALIKLPDWKGTAYRGMRLPVADFQQDFVVGAVIDTPTFQSTSKKTAKPNEFAKPVAGRPASVLLKLTLRTGRDVTNLSLVGNEDEVLVLPGTRFRVKSVEPTKPGKIAASRLDSAVPAAAYYEVVAEELRS